MKHRKISGLLPHRLSRRKGDTHDLAAELAPLEEQERGSKRPHASRGATVSEMVRQANGAIVVGDQLPQPEKDALEGGKRKEILGFDPIVLVIVAVMFVFILFIGWQISRMSVE